MKSCVKHKRIRGFGDFILLQQSYVTRREIGDDNSDQFSAHYFLLRMLRISSPSDVRARCVDLPR